LLKPVISFVVTIGIIGSFQVFDQIWVMSNGGPFRTTTTMAYLVYVEGFQQGRGLGYASALAMVLFAIILILSLIQRRFTEEQNAPR
jgi:multiple sugar transport system permease protein